MNVVLFQSTHDTLVTREQRVRYWLDLAVSAHRRGLSFTDAWRARINEKAAIEACERARLAYFSEA